MPTMTLDRPPAAPTAPVAQSTLPRECYVCRQLRSEHTPTSIECSRCKKPICDDHNPGLLSLRHAGTIDLCPFCELSKP